MSINEIPVGTKFFISLGFMPSTTPYIRIKDFENGGLVYNARIGTPKGSRITVDESENCVPCDTEPMFSE